MKKTILPILLSTINISLFEFIRNDVFLKNYWVEHYQNMGIEFPSAPINGAVWGIWALCFSISIYIISKKFTLFQSLGLAWFYGFILMWLVTGNLGVIPFKILVYAIPASILEVYISTWLIFNTFKKNDN